MLQKINLFFTVYTFNSTYSMAIDKYYKYKYKFGQIVHHIGDGSAISNLIIGTGTSNISGSELDISYFECIKLTI